MQKILPGNVINTIVKFIKIVCGIFSKLQVYTVGSAQAQIGSEQSCIITGKAYAARCIRDKLIAKMFNFVAKDFFGTYGTKRNQCVHIVIRRRLLSNSQSPSVHIQDSTELLALQYR